MANIAETENSYRPFVLIDHQQPPDLQLLARFSSSWQQWITAVITSRAVPSRASKLSCANPLQILCQSLADDVTLGHHSDLAIVLANRDGAYMWSRINLLAQSQIAHLRARVLSAPTQHRFRPPTLGLII